MTCKWDARDSAAWGGTSCSSSWDGAGWPSSTSRAAAALRTGCGDKLTARAELLAASQSGSSPAIAISAPSTPSESRRTAAATSDLRVAAIAAARAPSAPNASSAPTSGLEVDELALTYKRPSTPRVQRIRATPVALPPLLPAKSRAPLLIGAAICIALGIGAAWMLAHFM